MLKNLLLTTLLATSLSNAASCDFTEEQDKLLNLAISWGAPFDFEQTLPAIVMQESFVGDKVVKVNPDDGALGSYGVTHILLETGMWLEDKEFTRWEALELAEQLINDDDKAMELAVMKLQSVHKGNFFETWKNYNHSEYGGKYAVAVKENIRTLRECGYFNWG